MTGNAFRAFPAMPDAVRERAIRLWSAADRSPFLESDIQEIAALQRPWEPASCSDTMQDLIWAWLDEVAAWINEEHTWRTDKTVPLCWREHPHIANELVVIAFQRAWAATAVTSDPLAVWQADTLPGFLNRIAQRIGVDGCPPGRHQVNPGAERHRLYRQHLE